MGSSIAYQTPCQFRAASCDRFAARLRLGQPDAFGAGALGRAFAFLQRARLGLPFPSPIWSCLASPKSCPCLCHRARVAVCGVFVCRRCVLRVSNGLPARSGATQAAIPRRADSDVPRLDFTLLPRPRATASRPSGSRFALRQPDAYGAGESRSAHFPSLSATVLESVRVGSVERVESDVRGKTPKRVSRRFARLRTTTISLRAPRRFAIAPPPPLLRLRWPRWRPRHGRHDVIR